MSIVPGFRRSFTSAHARAYPVIVVPAIIRSVWPTPGSSSCFAAGVIDFRHRRAAHRFVRGSGADAGYNFKPETAFYRHFSWISPVPAVPAG